MIYIIINIYKNYTFFLTRNPLLYIAVTNIMSTQNYSDKILIIKKIYHRPIKNKQLTRRKSTYGSAVFSLALNPRN